MKPAIAVALELEAKLAKVQRVLDDPALLGSHTDESDCALCQVRVALVAALRGEEGSR